MEIDAAETLLTAPETAQYLRCSVRTLDRERADGRGCPFVRIGGRIRYRRADVEAFVAAHVRGHVTGVMPNVDTLRRRGRLGATLKSDARARLREAARTLLAIVAAGEEA